MYDTYTADIKIRRRGIKMKLNDIIKINPYLALAGIININLILSMILCPSQILNFVFINSSWFIGLLFVYVVSLIVPKDSNIAYMLLGTLVLAIIYVNGLLFVPMLMETM